MFSDRVPHDLAANRLTGTIQALRAEGRAFIDLTESNPTQAAFSYPDDLLAPLADIRALRYTPSPRGDADARLAIAREYDRQGLTVAPEHIVLTASTSEAYSLLFKLLANADDEVLVPRPSYPLFDHLTRLDLVTMRRYDLDYHGEWSIDFASLEHAFSPRTRAVLLVSPNNPTGSFVTARELDRMAATCADQGVAIIADEVFADYELEPGAARAAGRAVARRDVLAFALGGLSKSAGMPQVKLGWIAVGGPGSLVDAALERLELICDTYLSVSTPVQVAAADLVERGRSMRMQFAARIVGNYKRLKTMTAEVPSCRVRRSDGGWYAVLQVPSLEPEENLVLGLLTRDGVLTHPGYFYDFPCESFLVVSLLTPEATFTEGIARILRHFDCAAAPQQHG
jgi:hypothetical protein